MALLSAGAFNLISTFYPLSHPTPRRWRRCSWTPPPPRWSQFFFHGRARSSGRLDTTLRHDTARPDELRAAAASFFATWRSNIILNTFGIFTSATLAAAHSATTVRALPSYLTFRLAPERPVRSRHAVRKSTHLMLYGHFLTITNLHQRLHTPRTSTSALPRHYQTRTFLTAAENTPSPPLSCSPLSRTAHHPSAALCNGPCTC